MTVVKRRATEAENDRAKQGKKQQGGLCDY